MPGIWPESGCANSFMKYLITAVLMVCLAVSLRCTSDTSKTQSHKQPSGNFKGNKIPPGLKSKIVSVYGVFGTDTRKPSMKHVYNYDKTGRLTEWITYNADGSVLSKFISHYNEKGREIEVDGYKGDSSLYHKDVFKYDEKGNRVERIGTGYTERTPNSRDTYKYDDHNNFMGMVLGIEGRAPITITIIRNEKGERIEDDWYQDDKLNRKVSYKYDEKGNMTEEEEVFLDNNSTVKTIYNYNEKGYLSEAVYASGMFSGRKSYEYEFYSE